jgi:hypothetical protein
LHFLSPLYSLNSHLHPYLQIEVTYYAMKVQTKILCAFIVSLWRSVKNASNGRIVTYRYFLRRSINWPRCLRCVSGRLLAGVVGSNTVAGMDVVR